MNVRCSLRRGAGGGVGGKNWLTLVDVICKGMENTQVWFRLQAKTALQILLLGLLLGIVKVTACTALLLSFQCRTGAEHSCISCRYENEQLLPRCFIAVRILR